MKCESGPAINTKIQSLCSLHCLPMVMICPFLIKTYFFQNTYFNHIFNQDKGVLCTVCIGVKISYRDFNTFISLYLQELWVFELVVDFILQLSYTEMKPQVSQQNRHQHGMLNNTQMKYPYKFKSNCLDELTVICSNRSLYIVTCNYRHVILANLCRFTITC